MKRLLDNLTRWVRHRPRTATDPVAQADQALVRSLHQQRWPAWHQLRALPRVLPAAERRWLFGLLSLAALSGVWLIAQWLTVHLEQRPGIGGNYTEAAVGSPQYLNPVLAAGNDADRDLTALLFSGLLRVNRLGELEPDLAESYALSQDQKTYTVTLRPGLVWHDGEPLTAADVVFTVQAIQDPELGSPLAATFSGVQVELADERTVKLHLPQPFAPFVNALTLRPIPEHLWAEIPAANARLADLNVRPVGSGPFRFSSLTKDRGGAVRSYTLRRNQSFHRGAPLLEELTVRFAADSAEALELVRDRAADGFGGLPRPDLLQLAAESQRLSAQRLDWPQSTAIFLNPRANDRLADRRVRQALYQALDREALVRQVLDGNGEVVHGPLLPGQFGYLAAASRYPYDLAQAAKLLDEAGWKLQDGKRQRSVPAPKPARGPTPAPTVQTFELELTAQDAPEYASAAELIQQQWVVLGIQVSLRLVPRAQWYREVLRGRSYQVVLASQALAVDPDPFPFWHSSQMADPGLTLSAIPLRLVDQSLETARATGDPAIRQVQLAAFQREVTEQVAALFLYRPQYLYLQDADLGGFATQRISAPADRFSNVEQWYLETDWAWR